MPFAKNVFMGFFCGLILMALLLLLMHDFIGVFLGIYSVHEFLLLYYCLVPLFKAIHLSVLLL